MATDSSQTRRSIPITQRPIALALGAALAGLVLSGPAYAGFATMRPAVGDDGSITEISAFDADRGEVNRVVAAYSSSGVTFTDRVRIRTIDGPSSRPCTIVSRRKARCELRAGYVDVRDGNDRVTIRRSGSKARKLVLEIYGGAGNDVLTGSDGPEELRGEAGSDAIAAGSGRDTVLARDGRRDTVDCGSGRDRAAVDRRDIVRNCEIVAGQRR